MEEKYWDRFLETGKITDYLFYKGMDVCEQAQESHKGEISGKSDYSDRNDTGSDAGWRI